MGRKRPSTRRLARGVRERAVSNPEPTPTLPDCETTPRWEPVIGDELSRRKQRSRFRGLDPVSAAGFGPRFGRAPVSALGSSYASVSSYVLLATRHHGLEPGKSGERSVTRRCAASNTPRNGRRFFVDRNSGYYKIFQEWFRSYLSDGGRRHK